MPLSRLSPLLARAQRPPFREAGLQLLSLAALLVVFRVLVVLLRGAGNLPEEAYFATVPLGAMLIRPFCWILLGLQLLLLLKPPTTGWDFGESVLGGRFGFRLVCGMMAFISAWYFGLYETNHYFGQEHLVERGLLLGSAALFLWRPTFAPTLLLAIYLLSGQFQHPNFGTAQIAQPIYLAHGISLLAAFLLLRSVGWKLHPNVLAAALFAFLAAAYWLNGFQKARTDWFELSHPPLLLFSSYLTGWLSTFESETLSGWARALGPIAPLMKAGTIAIECAVIFLAWRRSLFLLTISGVVVFHFTAFLLTGIAFWMWVLVELALLLWVYRRSDPVKWAAFGLRFGLPVMAMVLLGRHLFNPPALSWYDCRISYGYRFEAVDNSGQRFVLGPEFFQPYSFPFTFSGFNYLSRKPALPVFWGATHRKDLAIALREIRDPDAARALEARFGQVLYSQAKANRFEDFLRSFFIHKASQSMGTSWHAQIAAPAQLWTSNDESRAGDLTSVERIEIIQLVSFFDDQSYQLLRAETVRVVSLPSSADGLPE